MTPREERPTESSNVYLRFRRVFGDPSVRSRDARRRAASAEAPSSVPFGAGRDPSGIADVLSDLTSRLGWNSSLARSELIADWAELAGAETAEHAIPVGIEEGVLTVRCDSTAWATQLRMMRAQITTRIAERFPEAGIESVRFEGPGVPSWKRGPRSIPGRGPRDTYG